MLRAPAPDPGLDPFRDGIAILRRDGEVAGHVASAVSTFWSPGRLFSWQWCVWFIIIWSNGDRELPFEDYSPWAVVLEIQSGTFEWEEDGPHSGAYTVEWLSEAAREAARSALGIKPEDL